MRYLVFTLLCLPLLAFADPGAATRYLLNEPASLMDIGLLRAETNLNRAAESIQSVSNQYGLASGGIRARAVYDYKNDLIVFIWVINEPTNPKKQCTQFFLHPMLVDQLSVFVHGETRGKIDTGGHKRVAEWFTHEGFVRNDQPGDLNHKILERVKLQCLAGNTVGWRQLLDDNIYWTKVSDE